MNFHSISSEEAVKLLSAMPKKADEKNKLTYTKKKTIFHRFIMQFSNFMIIILLIAAGVSFFVSVTEESGNFLEPIIILIIVFLNAVLGVVEEYKADKAIESLRRLSTPSALIRKKGRVVCINSEDVRVGDTLILNAGNCVCADARLVKSIDLESDEAPLTGEAMPISKDAECVLDELTPLAERRNMVFSGTNILHGSAEAVVTAIGMNSEMGKIASLLSEDESESTPLQKKLAQTGKNLGLAALSVCTLVFLMGIAKNIPPFTMFLTSISLAVAAIPEGLPAIVTIVLAIGVQRMAKKRAIVKHLSAVETLGSATVICADKTGTLTQNKMTVSELRTDNIHQLLESAVLCCNDSTNPTESSIISYAEQKGILKSVLERNFIRIGERPFDSKRKMMSVMVNSCGRNRIIAKGAPEILLEKCTYFSENNTTYDMSSDKKKQILANVLNMGEKSLRVIGVAYKDTSGDAITENRLIFLGLIGIMDPPRPEVKSAVNECKKAGIRPVMITGDNEITALAIASQTGFDGKALTGKEIASKNDTELTQYSIFARVTPADKMRIVKAFKKSGEIVAMTGDGVNDAPALKAADIGCSMGQKGTDVAKDASDLILADDNFASIVSAVREGRGIFENIRKSVQFLLSSNIGEIMVVFIGMIFGLAPLPAIQLLWVNLITDSLPALSLGLDPVDKNIMLNPPRKPSKSLFADGLWLSVFLEGCIIGALALLAYTLGLCGFAHTGGSAVTGRTMAFCVLSMSQLFHAFNMRSEHSVLNCEFYKNPYLLLSLILGISLQVSVINIDFLASIFNVCRLSFVQWFAVGLLSVMPLIIVELQKFVSRRFFYK